MERVELELSVPKLLEFSKNALNDGKLYLAVQNLNEAFSKCENGEDRYKTYLAYGDLFYAVNNFSMYRYALFMAAKEKFEGHYFMLDFDRFLPEPPPLPIQEEEEQQSEDTMNSSCVLEYNNVYKLISQRKYADAIKEFFCLPTDRKSIAGIIDALGLALDADPKFNLDEYLMSLLPVIGEYAAKDPEFIKLMLSGGDATKAIAVEGAKYFIEENDDYELLRDIGEAYFTAGEFETAERYLLKAVSICAIDDVSLYYLYATSVALKKSKEAKKYRLRYMDVLRFAMPPMRALDICATTVTDKNVDEYLRFTSAQEEGVYNIIYKDIDEPISPEQFIRVKEFSCLGNPYFTLKILRRLSQAKDKTVFYELCNVIMQSPFAEREVKVAVMNILLDTGYEGTAYCNLPEKAIICRLTKFRHRYGIWNQIFTDASEALIFADGYMPYYSELLSSVIKKCYEKFGKDIPDEDYDYYLFVALISYVHRLNENVTASSFINKFHFAAGELEEFLIRNSLESPIL